MSLQALEPSELVVELRAGLRIAVGQVDAADEHTIDRRFDVAALRVAGVARQSRARQDGFLAARENGDAVPGFLPAPHRAIARLAERIDGKFRVGGLELLQAGDVGPRRLEPLQQVRQPPVHVVDVEGRDLHTGTTPLSRARPTQCIRSSTRVIYLTPG